MFTEDLNILELKKQMFEREVLAQRDAVDKVLELPVNMAQILKNNVAKIQEKVSLDQGSFERTMKEIVVQATSDKLTHLKNELSKGFKSDGVTQTVMIFQETQWLCMWLYESRKF